MVELYTVSLTRVTFRYSLGHMVRIRHIDIIITVHR